MPDLIVITPDGATWDTRQAGEDALAAVRRHIPRPTTLGTQGMGKLRAYFADDFATQQPCPMADKVLSAIGYHHPSGWCGTVVLTMEEVPGGEIPALTPDVIDTLAELTGIAHGAI